MQRSANQHKRQSQGGTTTSAIKTGAAIA